MTPTERLEDARDNLRAAARFLRRAETKLDDRMMNAAMRNAFLTPEEKQEILNDLRCFGDHFGAAVEALAEDNG